MKHLAILISVLGLLVGVALAAEEQATMTASGQVISVDVKANTLSVKVDEQGKMRDVTFVVDSQTKILRDGGPIQLLDLKSGDRVTVGYRDVAGRTVAINIGVQRKVG